MHFEIPYKKLVLIQYLEIRKFNAEFESSNIALPHCAYFVKYCVIYIHLNYLSHNKIKTGNSCITLHIATLDVQTGFVVYLKINKTRHTETESV